jgi:hypothetical protein
VKSWLEKLRRTKAGKFVRRYWWAYPAWLAAKWGVIGLLGYVALADSREAKVEDSKAGAGSGNMQVNEALNLKAGDTLPDFTLDAWLPGEEQSGTFRPASLKGKTAFALYFYPIDDTPG